MAIKAIALFFVSILFFGCATTHKGPEAKKRQATNVARYDTVQNQGGDQGEENFSSSWNSPREYNSSSFRQKETGTIRLSPRQIQLALKKAGYYKGPIDGKIGSRTKEAIKSFQKARGLKADGIAGQKTIEKLSKYLN